MKRSNLSASDCETNDRAKLLKKSENNLFHDISMYILPTGIGSPRCKLLKSQVQKLGGTVHVTVMEDTNYIIVDDDLTWDKVCSILKMKNQQFKHVKIVKTLWLSTCLQNGCRVDTQGFEIVELKQKHMHYNSNEERKTTVQNINFEVYNHVNTNVKQNSSEHLEDEIKSSQAATKAIQLTGKWACAHPSSEATVNVNAHITEKLQILADTYKNTKDQWRALTYQKAISVLKNFPKEITSREEAKAIPGIGDSLADKIWEIIVNGSLRKVEEFAADGELKAIGIFTQIWGAGPTTAAIWAKQGYRTLEDLKNGAKLTRHQQIGLKYFDDLLEKMPREEAGKIIETVTVAVRTINPMLEAIGCGSYRRLKPTCGDVDVLITHPDGTSHANVLTPLVASLHRTGFLTDDLVGSAEMGAENKYMGICKLPGDGQKHRRIDLFVVPQHEFACALLAYTGSGHFNRSMRLLARKKGMALSHHSLNSGVIRKGEEKIFKGRIIQTPSEESIFENLGLEYRSPEERDH